MCRPPYRRVCSAISREDRAGAARGGVLLGRMIGSLRSGSIFEVAKAGRRDDPGCRPPIARSFLPSREKIGRGRQQRSTCSRPAPIFGVMLTGKRTDQKGRPRSLNLFCRFARGESGGTARRGVHVCCSVGMKAVGRSYPRGHDDRTACRSERAAHRENEEGFLALSRGGETTRTPTTKMGARKAAIIAAGGPPVNIL